MEKKSINLLSVHTKAQSKSEMYWALTVEGGFYLPPQKETTMQFISDIAVGDKKVLLSKDVVIYPAPHIKGIRSEDLVSCLIHECDAEDYLPSNYMEHIPNRSWLANLCNSLNSDKFQDLVSQMLSIREEHLLSKRNLAVDVTSSFANYFNSSRMVSVIKGKSHFLLRKNLLNKKKIQQKKLPIEREMLINEIPDLRNEIDYLIEECAIKDAEIEKRKADSLILKELFNKGLIDEDGNPLK